MIDNKVANQRMEIAYGIKDGEDGVDRNYEDSKFRGLIRGVAIMTKGSVSDVRGWVIDDITLDQIVAAGSERKKMGLKSRFGHPNMSSTALGTFLGRTKNFYKDGDVARADLYLSKTAYETPNGDLASYVLDLAEKDPDAFGISVVLGDFELEEQKDKKGNPKKDKQDNPLPPMLRVRSLRSADTVDDPAANSSMFGTFFNESVELSAKATEFFDKFLSNPEAVDFALSFLSRYQANRDDIDKEIDKEEPSLEKTKKEEVGGMELKIEDLTVEMLKKDRQDLVESLQSEATQAERNRVLSIVEKANVEFAGMGMEQIVADSIKDGRDINAALAAMRGKRLEDINKETKPAPGPDADLGKEKVSHIDRANKYKEEHGGTITEALQATAEPRKKKE